MAVKDKNSVITPEYAIYRGDCCKVLPKLPTESVGLSIFSPPFVSLYSYSDDPADMGNSKTYAEFFEHFRFLAWELHRLLLPGRIVAVHCMDLPTYKREGEEIGLRDFPGDLVRCFRKVGFTYHSRVCIWKDPLIAATRTKAIGLAHKQIVKDSSICRTGIADYILAFRKKGENPRPIKHPKGLTEYCGSRSVPHNLERFMGTADQGKNKRSHWIWQQYASPVWFDIRQTKVLPFREARDNEDVRHICLAKGSRVLTKERGYIAIQKVEVGEHVLTHKGRWRPVLAVQMTGVQRIATIYAQGVPGLKVTPQHKLWVRKTDWVRERDGAEHITPKWLEAENCLGGCYLNLKLPKEERPNITDCQHWWIVGRWLADGHWDARGGVHISCGHDKYTSLIEKLGEHAGFVHEPGPTSYQVRVKDRSGEIRETLANCGIGASGKHIPPEAFMLPFEQAKALLDGYLSGDGHFRKDRQRWMASSVSRDLLLGLSFLVQKVYGSIASIYAGRGPHVGTIRGRQINCKQEWQFSFNLVNKERYQTQFILDDGAWKKVRSVEDSGKRETWNLQVEEDESFTAEGCIVKNCPLQTDVIERCLILWSNPGDVVLSPFAGVGSEIYVAVKNGRKGLGVELKRSYWEQAVKNCKLAMRHQEHSIISRNGKPQRED